MYSLEIYLNMLETMVLGGWRHNHENDTKVCIDQADIWEWLGLTGSDGVKTIKKCHGRGGRRHIWQIKALNASWEKKDREWEEGELPKVI